MTYKTNKEIEKEFDELTPLEPDREKIKDTLYNEEHYPESEWELDQQKIINFISQIRQSDLKSLIENLEGMKQGLWLGEMDLKMILLNNEARIHNRTLSVIIDRLTNILISL